MVCEAQPHKYKCPKCRTARYCSSACYKAHTTVCVPVPRAKKGADRSATGAGAPAGRTTGGKRSAPGDSSGAAAGSTKARRIGRYDGGPTRGRGQGLGKRAAAHATAPPEPEEGDPAYIVVTDEQKARLRRDPAIRAALRDPVLQELLVEIDGSAADGGTRGRLPALEAARWHNPRFAAFADDVLVAAGLCKRDRDGRVVFAL